MSAISAADAGLKVLLLDKSSFPRDKICGDALSGKVAEVLRRNDEGFLDELDRGEAFLDSWGVDFYAPSGECLKVPFKKDYDTSDRAPGFIAKRVDFDAKLLERTLNRGNVEFRAETEIREAIKTDFGYRLISKKGEEIEATLVIAADGAYSTFARKEASLKAEGKELCYGLRAYFSGVQGLDPHGFIELHFLKEALPGYFWIFPLPNGYANVGVGMRADKMKAKGIKLKPLFEELIANHPRLKDRFANAEIQGSVRLFDLPLGNRKRPISGDHFMLVGDAAALIDPFTGEGIGNAMISGEIAGKLAAEAIQANNFSARFMKTYDRKVYDRLWEELRISSRLQELVNYPWLFNFVVRKANRNATLQETISCMFEDIDLRGRLKDPRFYAKILFQ
jgi:geranylgeranyl reductase family protein